MANQKLKIEITESDCHDLLNGETFDWTFKTDKGEDIDIHLFNPDVGEWCPRCIEDYQDDEGKWHNGTHEPSDCDECGVCKECEHMQECSKSK